LWKPKGTGHFGDPGLEVNKITLHLRNVGCESERVLDQTGKEARIIGFYENRETVMGSIKLGNFICHHVKEYPAL
jgi:hypothetical protein